MGGGASFLWAIEGNVGNYAPRINPNCGNRFAYQPWKFNRLEGLIISGFYVVTWGSFNKNTFRAKSKMSRSCLIGTRGLTYLWSSIFSSNSRKENIYRFNTPKKLHFSDSPGPQIVWKKKHLPKAGEFPRRQQRKHQKFHRTEIRKSSHIKTWMFFQPTCREKKSNRKLKMMVEAIL